MHTFFGSTVSIAYNGDYSGDVLINRDNILMSVPFEDLKEFVAQYVRNKFTEALEDVKADDLLRLALRRSVVKETK